ncbi:hypothetical protein BKA70DRAFT_1227590 [Coprinopsis sp. MPI-PUGE-AT-0042]|nr:hypothetical protein BKA70DRAFT_1227590 [Coprinopsis sp. MPI-PUGE-AT-0042]
MSISPQTMMYLIEASSPHNKGVQVDAAKVRASLLRPEMLPIFTLEMHEAAEPKITIGTRHPPNHQLSSIPLEPPPQLQQHAEWTQASLHLGATVIDRLHCFEEVLVHFKSLQNAITQFNAANANVGITSADYQKAEQRFGKQLPNVPRLMQGVLDAMWTPLLGGVGDLVVIWWRFEEIELERLNLDAY